MLEVADEGDFIEDFVGCSCVDMVAFVSNVVGVGTCSRVARLVWIPHRYVCNMGDVDPILFRVELELMEHTNSINKVFDLDFWHPTLHVGVMKHVVTFSVMEVWKGFRTRRFTPTKI